MGRAFEHSFAPWGNLNDPFSAQALPGEGGMLKFRVDRRIIYGSSFWSTLFLFLLLFCQINSDVVSASCKNGEQTII